MITIYTPQGAPLITAQERDESRLSRTLMGEHNVRLRFDWDSAVPLPYGSYIEYADKRWHLYASYIPTQRDGYSEYDVAFHAPEIELKNFTAFYTSQGRIEAEWDLTGTLYQFALEIQSNLQRIGSKLTIDPSLYESDKRAKHIQMSKDSIATLLGKVAEAFELDWWCDEMGQLHFGSMPLGDELSMRIGAEAVSYNPNGEGNPLISRLYAFGAKRNLTSKYRSEGAEGAISRIAEPRLQLPSDTSYITGVEQGIEHVEYFEEVYPRYEGTISAVSSRQSKDDTIYKMIDPDLHIEKRYILEGQTLKAQFTSGALQGMDFELSITSDGYEIVPNDSYGMRLPSAALIPAVGDKYVPYGFDISLVGDTYVSRAEQELKSKASEWLAQNNEDRRDVEVVCNPIWLYNYGTLLQLGQALRLVEATPIGDKLGRITRLEYPLYCPQAITLTVGNSKPTNRLESIELNSQKQAKEAKDYSREKGIELQQYTERRLSQALETMTALTAAMGERFGGAINPVAVHTMQLLAGDERLQFVFVKSLGERQAKPLPIEWLANSKSLRIAGQQLLMHYTIPNKVLGSAIHTERLNIWVLDAYQSPALQHSDKPYYLYAVCSKEEGEQYSQGYFSLETEPQSDTETDYYFLVGMLSTEDATGARSFVSLHGFSEILPGRITTDRIVSSDGKTYFDLTTGRINGRITITNAQGKPVLGSSTIIDGGIVLSDIIGAVDPRTRALRSYISGDLTKPAFVAGLSDDGATSNVAIQHDGNARFGQLYLDPSGIITFRESPTSDEHYMRIGGKLVPLAQLQSASRGSDQRQGLILGKRGAITPDHTGHYNYSDSVTNSELRLLYPNGKIKVDLDFTLDYQGGQEYEPDILTEYDPRWGMHNGGSSIITDYNHAIVTIWLEFETGRKEELGRYTKGVGRQTISLEIPYGAETYLMGIKYDVRGRGNAGSSVSLYGTASLSYESLSDTKEIAFGKEGMSLFFGHDRYLYAQRTGEPFLSIAGAVQHQGYMSLTGKLQHRGAVDMFGVLATGRCEQNGSIVFKGGHYAKGLSITRGAHSRYILRHNLGHQRYTISLITIGRRDVPTVYFIRDNEVEFGFRVDGTNYDCPFFFTLMGEPRQLG